MIKRDGPVLMNLSTFLFIIIYCSFVIEQILVFFYKLILHHLVFHSLEKAIHSLPGFFFL